MVNVSVRFEFAALTREARYLLTEAPDMQPEYISQKIRPDTVQVSDDGLRIVRVTLSGANVKADGHPGRNRHEARYWRGLSRQVEVPGWLEPVLAHHAEAHGVSR